jgi:thiol-disulfide isomerase/thioredoxin
MKKAARRRGIFPFLLALALSWNAPALADPLPVEKQDTEAAALARLLTLKLPDAQGKIIDFAAWRGKVRVINLWASWCAPCKAEMPAFSRLQDEFRTKDVQFVGIAIDTPEKVRLFTQKTPTTYPLPVGDETILALSGKLGNPHMGLPFTLVVDRQGKILARKAGRFLEEELTPLLRQGSGIRDQGSGIRDQMKHGRMFPFTPFAGRGGEGGRSRFARGFMMRESGGT